MTIYKDGARIMLGLYKDGARMNAKEYLRQIKYIENEINDKKEELIILRSRAESCSSPEINGMPSGSGGGDKLAYTVAKIVDLETYLQKKIKELNETYCQIILKIEQVQDRRERAILVKKYVRQQDWLDIANDLNCSVQTCYNIHGDALKSFSKIIGSN